MPGQPPAVNPESAPFAEPLPFIGTERTRTAVASVSRTNDEVQFAPVPWEQE
jgi:hypothetical protein